MERSRRLPRKQRLEPEFTAASRGWKMVHLAAGRGISKIPGRPQWVTVKSMDKCCILRWSPPKFDGGSTVTGYLVERQEIDRPGWIPVIQNCKEKRTVVKGLVENKQHMFRIAAVNASGTGEFLQTGTFTTAKKRCESSEDFTQPAAAQNGTSKLYHFRQRQPLKKDSVVWSGDKDDEEENVNSSEEEYLPRSDEEEDDDDEETVDDDEGKEELAAETEEMTECIKGTKQIECVTVAEEEQREPSIVDCEHAAGTVTVAEEEPREPATVDCEHAAGTEPVILLEEGFEVVNLVDVLTEPAFGHQHEEEPDVVDEDKLMTEPSPAADGSDQHFGTSSKIKVVETNNKEKRVYDKKQYCAYCHEPQSKLPRHLVSQHSKEAEVAQLMALPKGREKEVKIVRLRNLGNHLHNNKVIRDGEGNLVVVYRPTKPTAFGNYSPCPDCLGWYSRSELYRHTKECKLLAGCKPRHSRIQDKSRLLIDVPVQVGIGLIKVFAKMSRDDVYLAARGDHLILVYAQKLYGKYGHEEHQHDLIRRRLRDLGRLLIELRVSQGSEKCLGDFINPQSFKCICTATKKIAGFAEETNSFSAPSAADRIGLAVKGLAKTVQSEALQSGNTTSAQNAQDLFTCMENDWGQEIADHARRTTSTRKRNKVLVLPVTADIQKLARYVEEEGNKAYDVICNTDEIETAYETLRDCLLVSIMTFNRRRQGEVSRMKLSEVGVTKSQPNADVTETLSDFEKELVASLSRVEIRGKRGRTVPVILTKTMQRWLEQLLDARKKAGVLDSNPYFFARLASDTGYIRGCDVLRHIGVKVGAAAPNSLRSTLLRKHIATTSQILNLRDNELDILANFLGHDIAVHRRFYRLPQETLQLAKVSKLLLAMESGNVAALKGQNLDSIQLGPDEEVEDDRIIEEEELDGDKEHDIPTDELLPHVPQAPQQALQVPPQDQAQMPAVPIGKSPAGVRRTWSKAEITAVEKHFLKNITLSMLPGKAEIETCIRCEHSLHRRHWKNIKDYIRNRFAKNAKKA